jgi:8-oxo-dGTP pyrophosphatase MutT (NUDIX family)
MLELFADPVVSLVVEHIDCGRGILLQKREKLEPVLLNGLFELPQGRVRRGESILECAERELREETGLYNFRAHRSSIREAFVRNESLQFINSLIVSEAGEHSYLAVCLIGTAQGTERGSSESSSPSWHAREEVSELLASNRIFPLNVPMLRWYLEVTSAK